MPPASTLTCISRPGSQFSHGARPRNISSDSRVRNRISPIQMNSGSAAKVHDALLPQIVVASTAPAGMPPPTNCMPTYPHAIRAIAIQMPPVSSTARKTSNSSEMVIRSTWLHPALDRLLDDLFGGLRLGLLVARRVPAQHVDQLVDEGDQQDDEAAAVAELRDPQRHGQHTLGHVVEAKAVPGHAHGVPGEEADEEAADRQGADLDGMAGAGPQPIATPPPGLALRLPRGRAPKKTPPRGRPSPPLPSGDARAPPRFA